MSAEGGDAMKKRTRLQAKSEAAVHGIHHKQRSTLLDEHRSASGRLMVEERRMRTDQGTRWETEKRAKEERQWLTQQKRRVIEEGVERKRMEIDWKSAQNELRSQWEQWELEEDVASLPRRTLTIYESGDFKLIEDLESDLIEHCPSDLILIQSAPITPLSIQHPQFPKHDRVSIHEDALDSVSNWITGDGLGV